MTSDDKTRMREQTEGINEQGSSRMREQMRVSTRMIWMMRVREREREREERESKGNIKAHKSHPG